MTARLWHIKPVQRTDCDGSIPSAPKISDQRKKQGVREAAHSAYASFDLDMLLVYGIFMGLVA